MNRREFEFIPHNIITDVQMMFVDITCTFPPIAGPGALLSQVWMAKQERPSHSDQRYAAA